MPCVLRVQCSVNLLPQRILSTHSKQDACRVEVQKSLQVRGDRYGEGWRQDVLGEGRIGLGLGQDKHVPLTKLRSFKALSRMVGEGHRFLPVLVKQTPEVKNQESPHLAKLVWCHPMTLHLCSFQL